MRKINFRKHLLMLTDALLIALSALASNAIMSLCCVLFKLPKSTYVVNDIRILWVILLNVLFCFFMLYICGAYSRAWRDFNAKDYVYCTVGVMAGLILSGFFASLADKQGIRCFILQISLFLPVASFCLDIYLSIHLSTLLSMEEQKITSAR